ncbi:MAG: hypothetical protein M1823_003883 [Watsoniomyces obsoletus]|nr:MAG: hypothetical protein M1823_003883 [Watsoniomyces obsoletus]
MSFLQHTPLDFQAGGVSPEESKIRRHPSRRDKSGRHVKDKDNSRRPASTTNNSSSGVVSRLVHLVKDPVAVVGELAEGFWEVTDIGGSRAQQAALDRRKQAAYTGLKNALSYDDWRRHAEELDRLEGHEAWKADTSSPDYDVELVGARLNQLDEARLAGDVDRMIFLVRTSFTRGLGDMGNARLYRRSHVGTKVLIERYINSALATLEAILTRSARASYKAMDTRSMLERMLSARQAFGRSAMLLSGGAMLGLNHIGVLKALWEAELLPRIISGASAGSIVAAVLCTTTDEEIPKLLKEFPYRELAVFDREDDGLLRRFARLLKVGAVLDIRHLTEALREFLGDLTFQEAYNRTRRILNICVSSASMYELPRLLNYVTAPNVLIWSAVAASCSVPVLFTAASVLVKDPKTGQAMPWNPSPQRYIDGSVDNDLPMTRLAEMFNVNHFIVSQVNPHVIPFLARDDTFLPSSSSTTNSSSTTTTSSSTTDDNPSILYTLMNLAKAETLHRMHVLAELGIFPNALTKARSVLSQKYSGDITIVPEISYTDFPRMLTNPTPEFIRAAMLTGERATWPKLSRVRNHCAIELALDGAVQALRARVAFSPSQVDLRRLNNAFGFGLGMSRVGDGQQGQRVQKQSGRNGKGVVTGGGVINTGIGSGSGSGRKRPTSLYDVDREYDYENDEQYENDQRHDTMPNPKYSRPSSSSTKSGLRLTVPVININNPIPNHIHMDTITDYYMAMDTNNHI